MIGSQLVENTGSFFKLISFEEGVILTIHYIILLTLRNSINKPTREGSQTHRVHQTNWRWKPSLAVAKCQNSLSSGKKRRQNDIKLSGWAQRNGQFVLVDWRQVNPFAWKLNLRDSPLVSRRKIWKVKQLKLKPVHYLQVHLFFTQQIQRQAVFPKSGSRRRVPVRLWFLMCLKRWEPA